MTRRQAILIGLGTVPGWAFASKEFWNEKPPAEWTDQEIQEMLTRSPWAKDASVTYNSGPGGAGARSGRPGRIAGASPDINRQQYKAVVRWESALPIRQAAHNRSMQDLAQNYIISVTGDVPMLGGRRADEDEAQRLQRLEMFKEYTRLERKHDPIYVSKVDSQSGPGTLFYFSRIEPIKLEDRQITFFTKLGPVELKAKFTLKDMVYRGKLEL